MSHAQKDNELVHSERPPSSEPVLGHGGTSYENVDASVRMVILSLVVIALILLVSFAVTIPIQKTLHRDNPPGVFPTALAPSRVIPPEPRIEVHPWDYYPDLLASQQKVLNSAGKDPSGAYHFPIGQAVDAVATRLNVRPNSAPGLTIPGGQGRDFAGSLANMPPAYQPPTIQGEIRKNAQPQVTK
ncbi:MAG: hypothetical protein JWP08_2643 [Bryobacterales bacterium]|nr:hypothetical protein [Bryobacterales bacterium]